MLKTVSTIVLVLGLAATGCSKKKDAPAGDKPATTEAAKPAEGAKPTEAPKTEEAKPAEAPKADETKAAPAAAGAVTFATDDEYIAAGKASLAKMTEAFKAGGTDCAKLTTELNTLGADPKFAASKAYEKAHPEVSKKFDDAAKAETDAFMAAAGPAIKGCMNDKAFGEAIQKLGE